MKPKSDQDASGIARREFVKTLILGGGATAVLAAGLWPESVFAAGHTDVLLLSCMDYRLVDETGRYMNRRGLRDKYDHIVLAGASLGAVTEKYPDWNQTFWDHLGLAIDLHKIHKVIILDHRDCGAYKQILGEDFSKNRKKETRVHATYLKQLKELIKQKHQELEVELLLMNLAGKVERI